MGEAEVGHSCEVWGGWLSRREGRRGLKGWRGLGRRRPCSVGAVRKETASFSSLQQRGVGRDVRSGRRRSSRGERALKDQPVREGRRGGGSHALVRTTVLAFLHKTLFSPSPPYLLKIPSSKVILKFPPLHSPSSAPRLPQARDYQSTSPRRTSSPPLEPTLHHPPFPFLPSPKEGEKRRWKGGKGLCTLLLPTLLSFLAQRRSREKLPSGGRPTCSPPDGQREPSQLPARGRA